MKIHIILLSCICSSLAITVYYEKNGSSDKNAKEYRTALKDIRLVPVNEPETLQKSIKGKSKEIEEAKNFSKPREQPKITRQSLRRDKKKFTPSTARVGNIQNVQNDPLHQNYMQKMANQLYLAQKHASLLSDYQKFIINQDPNVKNFVLAQSIQERNPKPFSRQRHSGRAISAGTKIKHVPSEPLTSSADYSKIVVVTPKLQTTVQPQKDHSAQATHIKYVTLAPQSLTHFVESQEPSPKVTLVPYHSPQPYTYYDLGVTQKPQVETVQIPATVSLGLGSYESSQYYKPENEHEDKIHHGETKYEFMYNVKDHEKQNHFGHKESRTDKTTYGYYFVHLPDGRLETVKYWADKTGYHAKVDYQGEAKHPIHSEHKHHSLNFVQH